MILDPRWDASRRYGMFIHWGLYALAGFHEQYQYIQSVPRAEYAKLADRFNPMQFDARAIVRTAKDAGMRYLCVTTKHHDGFCMWDTAETDYKVTNTPFGRDVIREFADACAEADLALCLYYSIPDWHHPDAYNEHSSHQMKPEPEWTPEFDRYKDYIRRQITELLSGYGRIAALFWDIPPRISDPSLNELVRTLQPDILINDRGFDRGDYSTPERDVPGGKRFSRATEACQSIGRVSWGFRVNEDYYSDRYLMRELDKMLAMGGNYLLNVGPKPDGTIPAESVGALRRIGGWYHRVEEALVGTVPYTPDLGRNDCLVTRRGATLYLHMPDIAVAGGLFLNPIRTLPVSCTLLNDGRPLRTAVESMPPCPVWTGRPPEVGEYLHVSGIPVNDFAGEPVVIKLVFASETDFPQE